MREPFERDFGEKKRILYVKYKGKEGEFIPFDELDELKDRIEAHPIEKSTIYRRRLYPGDIDALKNLRVYIEYQNATKKINPYRKAPEPRQSVPRARANSREGNKGRNNGEKVAVDKPQEIHLPLYESGFIILGKDNKYKVNNGEEGLRISIDTFQGSSDGKPRKRTVGEILENARQGGYNFVATDERGRYAYMFKISNVPESLQNRTVSQLEGMISKGAKVSF